MTLDHGDLDSQSVDIEVIALVVHFGGQHVEALSVGLGANDITLKIGCTHPGVCPQKGCIDLPNIGYGSAMQSLWLSSRVDSSSTWFLLLNDDVQGDFAGLKQALAAVGPTVGFAAPGAAGRYLEPGSRWDHRSMIRSAVGAALASKREADQWPKGCYVAVRADAISSIGGFDERFFLYFEETDMFSRLESQGWSGSPLSGVEFEHDGAASTDAWSDASATEFGISAWLLCSKRHSGFARATWMVSFVAQRLVLMGRSVVHGDRNGVAFHARVIRSATIAIVRGRGWLSTRVPDYTGAQSWRDRSRWLTTQQVPNEC